MSITEKLAKFCFDTTYDHLPIPVIQQAKYFFLDYLAITLRAAKIDSTVPISKFVASLHATGKATVFGEPKLTSPYWAALVNGTAAHSLELDDTYLEGSIHNECFIYSAALAQAEEIEANGKKLIEAAFVGFEIACRLARALQPAITNARGFHPTGTCGAIGAAVAAGKILGLSEQQFVHAIGIACSQSSGLLEYVTDGAWTKRFHAGWAAHAGLVAANLAKQGLTGPKTAIEGKFGFLQAFSGKPILDGLLNMDTGEYKILETAIKYYPCNYYIQSANEAMLMLVEKYKLTPTQVKSITVYTLTAGFNLVCEPHEQKCNPQSTLDAQFSMPFNVAVALINKKVTLAEYTKETFNSELVQQTMKKITCKTDPELDAQYPAAWPARIEVITQDNKTFTQEIKFAKGTTKNPLTWQELIIKHKSIVNNLLSSVEDEKLIDFVWNLEEQKNFDLLSKIVRNTQLKEFS